MWVVLSFEMHASVQQDACEAVLATALSESTHVHRRDPSPVFTIGVLCVLLFCGRLGFSIGSDVGSLSPESISGNGTCDHNHGRNSSLWEEHSNQVRVQTSFFQSAGAPCSSIVL